MILSSLLPLNVVGSQTLQPKQQQENPRSTRKRPRSPEQQEYESKSPDADDRPVANFFMSPFVVDQDPELASSVATTNYPQQPGLLSPRPSGTPSPYLNPEFDPRAAKPWLYHTPPPEYFQPASFTVSQEHQPRVPYTNDSPGINSFIYDYPTDEQPEPSSCAAAVSPAPPRPPTPALPAPTNSSQSSSNGNHCDNPNCPLSKLTTKKMVLNYPPIYFRNPDNPNTCRNKAVHKINGEPLGFILLDNLHSKHWSDVLIRVLSAPGGCKFFEHQDRDGKTTLHKLVGNISTSPVTKMLYNKLDSFDTQDEQGHTPLYAAIEYSKNNCRTLTIEHTNRVHEKIKILLSRNATIDKKILKLATSITDDNRRIYINKLLQKALRSRRQTSSNRDRSPAAARSR